MEQAGNNYSYNAAQAFNQVCAVNGVEGMAYQNHTVMSASNPGLPPDSFRRQTQFASTRYTQAPSQASSFMKGLGSMFSSIGMVSKIVAMFYPPAAAVSSVAEIASPVLDTLSQEGAPKPVVITTQQKYNPWVR
ncbi:MAG: hypothetical protein U0354_04425 [Candidatus Sericytochromatia bacterium]